MCMYSYICMYICAVPAREFWFPIGDYVPDWCLCAYIHMYVCASRSYVLRNFSDLLKATYCNNTYCFNTSYTKSRRFRNKNVERQFSQFLTGRASTSVITQGE
jgi:hypothetical protein